MELQAVDVERAIELIEEKGWIQGDLETPTGYCAIGAVRTAVKERLGRYLNLLPAGHELAFLMGFDSPHWTEVANFNDMRGRTKEEVQERLMLAAKKLREMGR